MGFLMKRLYILSLVVVFVAPSCAQAAVIMRQVDAFQAVRPNGSTFKPLRVAITLPDDPVLGAAHAAAFERLLAHEGEKWERLSVIVAYDFTGMAAIPVAHQPFFAALARYSDSFRKEFEASGRVFFPDGLGRYVNRPEGNSALSHLFLNLDKRASEELEAEVRSTTAVREFPFEEGIENAYYQTMPQVKREFFPATHVIIITNAGLADVDTFFSVDGRFHHVGMVTAFVNGDGTTMAMTTGSVGTEIARICAIDKWRFAQQQIRHMGSFCNPIGVFFPNLFYAQTPVLPNPSGAEAPELHGYLHQALELLGNHDAISAVGAVAPSATDAAAVEAVVGTGAPKSGGSAVSVPSSDEMLSVPHAAAGATGSESAAARSK